MSKYQRIVLLLYILILVHLLVLSIKLFFDTREWTLIKIILYYGQQMHKLFHKFSPSYMFREYRVILRELVINTLPSYTSISNAAFLNAIYD
jgi:hypothetical protein